MSMNKSIFILASVILLSSCGVSDYINRKKIVKANTKISTEQSAQPATSSKCEASDSRKDRIVKYINQARSEEQLCGNKTYEAAPLIVWNTDLFNAAKLHSNDMAQHNIFSHTGSDHSTTGKRVTQVGYDWKAVAENISAGTDTPEQTVDRWLTSPGHCHNLMNPVYTEFGLACTINPDADYQIYWTLVLATPR